MVAIVYEIVLNWKIFTSRFVGWIMSTHPNDLRHSQAGWPKCMVQK